MAAAYLALRYYGLREGWWTTLLPTHAAKAAIHSAISSMHSLFARMLGLFMH
jgi:hypothetical protein